MPTISFPQSLLAGTHDLNDGGAFDLDQAVPAGSYALTKLIPPPPVDIWGADFSKYNGTVDFKQVVAANYLRLIHRATLGATGTDLAVVANLALMKAANPLYLGVYHLFIKGVPGLDQFNNIKKFLEANGSVLNYPVTVDLEPLSKDVIGNVNTEVIIPFHDLLSRLTQYLGYRPVIYTAEWAVEKFGVTGDAFLLDYPLHFAHYTQGAPFLPNPWRDAHKPWLAWQCDNGEMPWSVKVPGSAKTDRSRYSSLGAFPIGFSAP